MTAPGICCQQDDDSLSSEVSSSSSQLVRGMREYASERAPENVDKCVNNRSNTDASALLCGNIPSTHLDESSISEYYATVRSLSNHGNAISESMRTEVGDDGLVDFFPAGDSDLSSRCFFPEHAALSGPLPMKVTRYAQKRINKAKISPCERARNMTIVRHNQLELGALLGEGSFSSVYSIRRLDDTISSADGEIPDAAQLVVKFLRKKLLRNPPMLAACAADLVKEGLLLSRFSHENVVSIHAWAPRGVQAFTSGRHDATFLLLGKLETTLSAKLLAWRAQKQDLMGNFITCLFPSSKVKLQAKWQSFQDRVEVIDGLMEGVVYLHSQHILHRDLKPDNVGFDAKGVLKIFDFDVARVLPATLKYSTCTYYLMTRRVGSPRYMSPECARGDPYNAKSDVYTVALLLHELISLDKPYDDIPSDLHDDMVFYSAARPPLPPKWPEPFKSTLQRAWNERIPIRPTMVEFQTIWKSQLKSVLLEDKRRRYSRGLGGRQAVLPNVDSSVTVPNKSTRAFEIWNSTRTSPDSCQELSESCSE